MNSRRLSLDGAALVVEFHPERLDDVVAVMRLAQETTARIIAVAQRSSDARLDRLRSRFRDLSNLDFYALGTSFGRGSAIRFGLSKVREPMVGILSLEDRIDPADIARYFGELESRLEIDGIVSYRSGRDGTGLADMERHWRSRAYNTLANLLLGTNVRDVQSPFKIFRSDVLRPVLDDLQLFDHGFDADLLSNARRRHVRFIELPIQSTRVARRWPLVPTAFKAALSLVVLRLLDSRLGGNNIVAFLGRPVVLPFKKQYSILIFCWRDPLSPKAGGGEVYLHEQARCWVQQGHRVTWVAQAFRGSKPREELDGIEIVRRGVSLFVFARAAIWYVFRSGWKFDFIIDTMNGVPFFTPLFSRKPKVCLLYHMHSEHFRDELTEPLASLAVAIETKLVPFVYRRTPFVTISDSSAMEMRALHMSALPVRVIHSGVSDDLVPGRKSAAPTILFIGRLRRYKRVRKLIDAFVAVKVSVPDARLVIAGTGDDERSLRDYCAGISGVTFAGRVDNAEKVRLLQEAWVFGMPSSLEGWGIVVIEAACCATPSIAYDVNGLRDCVIDGVTGLLARTDAEFDEHLQSVLTDDVLRARLSEASVAWGSSFSWSATAARTLGEIRRAQPWSAVFEPDMPSAADDGSIDDRRTAMARLRG